MKIDSIELTKDFRKQLHKLPPRKVQKAIRTIKEFDNNPFSPRLRLHELKGGLANLYSISAGGDLRLHFEFILVGNVARFVAIGTHAQLYK